MADRPPVALVILDGWGLAPDGPGNAVATAVTPTFDRIHEHCPGTTLAASGLEVGLPEGQIGNSEVGHLNLGAGRVVYQDLTRIDQAIEDGSFFDNDVLQRVCTAASNGRGVLHLIGLTSFGGVHSHLHHFIAMARMAAERGVREVRVHAITDGRDVSPTATLDDMEWLERKLGDIEAHHDGSRARVASVIGRYWAMDRDQRWERTKRAFDLLVDRRGRRASSARDAVRQSHEDGITDEFIEPFVIDEPGAALDLDERDAVLFMNFRPDRMRQLVPALTSPRFPHFERDREFIPLRFSACMSEYDPAFSLPVAFPQQQLANTLADVLEQHGIGQLHVAETEKYAHVTYFFNGGREPLHAGEQRHLAPSPRDVATYDLKPEMAVDAVADLWGEHMADPSIGFGIINFANPDMVGHTGSIPAATTACERVDSALARVLDAVAQRGGTSIVTADHGNAETMLTPAGQPHTAHTTNPVPCIIVTSQAWRDHALADHGTTLRDGGRLADIAPTVLDLLDLPQPADMTGTSLLQR